MYSFPLTAGIKIHPHLSLIIICLILGPDQIPLMEDLEQILMRSWRESHLTEIRQYQQSHAQFPAPLPGLAQPLTPSQLPWLAKLATSSCGDAVLVLDTAPSLTEALADTFQRLMEGKLSHTHFVVIICMSRSQETESCIVVTGKRLTCIPHVSKGGLSEMIWQCGLKIS